MDLSRRRVGMFSHLGLAMSGACRVLAFATVIAGASVWQTAAAGSAGPATVPQAYRLGVFPYIPVAAIDRLFGPVALQLAEDLGRPVHLKTKPTFAKFAEELSKETYDIILVHPFFYISAHEEHGYVPLARLDEPLTAVVLVREDDPLEGLLDLEDRTIGLPPTLAAATELVMGALLDAGLRPGVDVELRHFRSKSSCLRAVASGRTAACALPSFAIAQIDPGNRRKLRAIFESEPVANFLFAAHARVPDSDRTDVARSILAWPFTAKGRKILSGGAWSRFVPALDQDYDEVRRHLWRLQHVAER